MRRFSNGLTSSEYANTKTKVQTELALYQRHTQAVEGRVPAQSG